VARTSFKAHKEFVTAADHAANQAIQAVLRRMTPDSRIVSEEGPLVTRDSILDTHLQWILDPLDGTTNYTIGLPLWGISLALVKDGVPVRGWLSLPKLGERYVARLGEGAWRNGKKFRITKRLPLASSVGLFCHGYREEEKAADLGTTGPLMRATHTTRRLGAACVELAWVATGRASYLVIYGAKPWDLSAGTLLVTEAGGLVSRPDGEPWSVGDPDCVAANPASYEQVLRIVRKTPNIR
jgi:myo-inositol-1(or 4)-monophosphatase